MIEEKVSLKTIEKREAEADLHIMFQLKKALHSPSQETNVTFSDGPASVKRHHAHAALVAYELKKPNDKAKFQNRLLKSYAELQRAISEEANQISEAVY